MLFLGRVLNAKNEKDNTVFDGYSVNLSYLSRPVGADEGIFKEQSDTTSLSNGINEFQFTIPEIERLQQDHVFSIYVLDRGGKEVFAEKYPLLDTVKQQLDHTPILIKLKPSAPETVPNPLKLRGNLQWKDNSQDQTGFDSYSVVVRFKTNVALGADNVANQSEATITCQKDGLFSSELPSEKDLLNGVVELAPKYPNGSLGIFETKNIAQLKEKVVIIVERQQATALFSDPRVAEAISEKTKGKVVDLSGKAQVKNAQVIIWGKKSERDVAQPILVALTDAFGGFSGERLKVNFTSLAATVAGTKNASPENAIPVDFEPDSKRLPKFVYLVVELDDAKNASDDCSCHDGQTPRLPDSEDLIKNPSTYSQDIGINCVNFTTPNRTLEEFTYTMVVRTTDPEIKSTTISDVEKRRIHFEHFERALSLDVEKANSISAAAAEVGSKSSAMLVAGAIAVQPQSALARATGFNISKSFAGDFVLKDIAQKYRYSELAAMVPGRTELNASTAIDWDSTPTFYQAATIAHGHILHFKQEWKADGYSMGDLLYSLPLAPGQKKQIVIFDWDRTEFGRRDEDNHEDSALNAYLSNNRDVTDIVRGSFAEQTSGSSSASTSGRAGGIGGAVGGMIKGIFFGAVGGFSASGGDSESSASQSSSRQIATTGLQQLHQVINQGASSVRNARQTVVQTGRQTERFKVQTEVVANHNHCHAITIEYFEVLRHYAIESKLSHVQECLFIPLLITQFDVAKVVRWRNILQDYLKLPPPRGLSSIFGAHPLIRGLDACERINSRYEGSDFPMGMYAEEVVESVSGELWIRFQLNRPQDADDSDPNADPTAMIAGGIIGSVFGPIGTLLGAAVGDLVSENFNGRRKSDKGKIFEENIAPRMARAFIDQIVLEAVMPDGTTTVPLPVDVTMVSDYQRDAEIYVTIRPFDMPPGVSRKDIRSIKISTTVDISKIGQSKVIVSRAQLRYSTAHLNGYLFRDSSVDNDLLPNDAVVIPCPLNAEEKRDPHKEDIQFSRKLLDHLNADIEYYHKMIWLNMDPDRRFMLLDGHIAPNTKGPGTNGRSVASVVENQVVGIVGNCLVMPVAPGYRLDPTYKVNPILDEQTGKPMTDKRGNILYPKTDLIDHYQPLTPVPAFRVSVPTRGVFAEAVMGACNSCERKDETRFWRWEESPNPDEPTAINPIQTTPPQRSDPGNLQAAPFSNPIIAMQNAPAAPDPGATLAGALNLLGKSDVFQNITGLDQNQKNALQGMLSNQESAKHYADKAVEMAKMAAMQKGGNATVDNIKKSMDEGVVDKETGKKLIEDVYRAQISGKTSADEARQADTASNSDLGKAIAKRVADGAPISATQDHKDGTSTTVDQKTSDAKSLKYDFVVPGTITPLQQPSSNGCWATVSAIMYNWKNKTNKTTEDVITAVAPDFAQYISTGLPIDKIEAYNSKIGFKSVSSNTNFPINAYYDLLQKYGPVWIIDLESSDPKSLHGRVLIGIKGDDSSPETKLILVDPASGSRYEEALSDFVKKTEAVVKTLDVIKDARIPLATYFATKYSIDEFASAVVGASPAKQKSNAKGLTFSTASKINATDLALKIKSSTKIPKFIRDAFYAQNGLLRFKDPSVLRVPNTYLQSYLRGNEIVSNIYAAIESGLFHFTTAATKKVSPTRYDIEVKDLDDPNDMPGHWAQLNPGRQWMPVLSRAYSPKGQQPGNVSLVIGYTYHVFGVQYGQTQRVYPTSFTGAAVREDAQSVPNSKRFADPIPRGLVAVAVTLETGASNTSLSDDLILSTFLHELACHAGYISLGEEAFHAGAQPSPAQMMIEEISTDIASMFSWPSPP
jgi:Papain-like cysteine protease AvrRpt2